MSVFLVGVLNWRAPFVNYMVLIDTQYAALGVEITTDVPRRGWTPN